MILFSLILAGLAVTSFVLYLRLNKYKFDLASNSQIIAGAEITKAELNRQVNDLFQEKSQLQMKLEEYIEKNGRAQAQVDTIGELNGKMEKELSLLKEAAQQLQNELFHYKQQVELKNQAMQEIEKRMKDWESARNEAVNHAKAAIFEAGSKLSNQLLEKHKAENVESQAKISKTTAELQTQFEKILSTVAVMDSEIKSSRQTVEIVKNSLLTPAGAGGLAELTLENILKASGLASGRDYVMQYSLSATSEHNKLRPDAVVFLPANNILIIDSKASKFFTELAQASNKEEESEIFTRLKNTMRLHLKSLQSKDYKEALRLHLSDREVNHISSVMFLPSEAAVEKIGNIDKDFITKAWEQDIFPVGPTGLVNILTNAKFQIAAYNQQENQQQIISEIRKLLNSFLVLHEYAKKMGSSIQSAANNYDKLAASFNANFLPKARNLEKLGIHLPKNKTLPGGLERLTVISANKLPLIEVDDYSTQEEEEDA